MIFRGSRPVLLRNPIFCEFSGGGGGGGGPDPLNPHLEPHLISFLCFLQEYKLLIYAFIGSVSRDDKHRKSELMRF